MSRHIPSHRVEIVDDDGDNSQDRSRVRDKSPPRASTSDRDRQHHDRHYSEYDHYRMPPHYGYHPMYQPYYGPPVVYQPPHDNRSPQQYGHYQGHWGPHHNQGSPQHNGQNGAHPMNGSHQQAAPQGYHPIVPQYLAVNVKNDTHQSQTQDQNQEMKDKTITIKEKVINNVTRGLEGMLDMKVLAAGVGALVLQHFVRQAQENSKKSKKKGLSLTLGLL